MLGDLFHCHLDFFNIFYFFCLCTRVRALCCRPAPQNNSGESYGGLSEGSLEESYSNSKDGTLVVREVTAPTVNAAELTAPRPPLTTFPVRFRPRRRGEAATPRATATAATATMATCPTWCGRAALPPARSPPCRSWATCPRYLKRIQSQSGVHKCVVDA